jgi:hypothetical protein
MRPSFEGQQDRVRSSLAGKQGSAERPSVEALNRANRMLGGFLEKFRGLPADEQREIYNVIKELKGERARTGDDKLFERKLSALVSLYGCVVSEVPRAESPPGSFDASRLGSEEPLRVSLAERLEAVQRAVEAEGAAGRAKPHRREIFH